MTDDDEIWTTMCVVAAQKAGIPVERAKAILDANGFHAYGHTGLVEAIEIVTGAVGIRWKPSTSS